MSDITIPPEALEAVAKVLHDHAEIFDDVPWEDLSDSDKDAYIEEARAACLALIQSWPGMDTRPNIYGRQDAILILPLPTENSNERE